MDPIMSAPFGARGLSLAMIAAQAAADACPKDTRVGKWRLIRGLSEARAAFRLGDRAVTVLSALLSFHPEDELSAETALIVFPSNQELCRRAHGISEPTLRRALAQLVEGGLILRRDSPNGKRYARRDASGSVERAFGFDLRPLVARADEIAAAASAVLAERQAIAALREEVTLLRRGIVKALELAASEAIPGPFAALAHRFLPLSGSSNRGLGREALEVLRYDLGEIAASLDKCLSDWEKSQNMTGNDSQTDRHKQDSKPNPIFDSERSETGAREFSPRPSGSRSPSTTDGVRETEAAPPSARSPSPDASFTDANRLHLGTLLKACPAIIGFARHGISTWADLLEAAEKVRPALGISPDAWMKAVAAMGESGAAVTLAVILERVNAIRSPGGYLRALTTKAGEGGFTPAPLVFALLRSAESRSGN